MNNIQLTKIIATHDQFKKTQKDIERYNSIFDVAKNNTIFSFPSEEKTANIILTDGYNDE